MRYETLLMRTMTVLWDVAPYSLVEIDRCLIALMMEAVSTSKTSVSLYQTTRRNIPEDSHLHTRRRENLKLHQLLKLIDNLAFSLLCLYN
jgi:hypothetical protein